VIYQCCTSGRRAKLIGQAALNGIDFLEVLDGDQLPDDVRQRTLFVHFVNPLTITIPLANARIEGGERIRNISITAINPTDDDRVLAVQVDKSGDFSIYTLRLVEKASDALNVDPPAGIDRVLAAVDFSFKVACPATADCVQPSSCPPPTFDEPPIDYLAKDYASFRRLMLDRLALLQPGWAERNSADVGVALVELLAYVGDYLSYQQDAVATEAYLGTARRRVSARRHARLVDYHMHDGCNARVWVQIRAAADTTGYGPNVPVPRGTQLLTQLPGLGDVVPPGSGVVDDAVNADALVFETIEDLDHLFVAHNQLTFYTWDGQNCCLPAGATSATLLGSHPTLQPYDVLIFEEICGPRTGKSEDADPSHRCAVRVMQVVTTDRNGQPLQDEMNAQPITEISWDARDALPFPLCISATADDGSSVPVVSVALGNVVLADHGRTLDQAENLGTAPGSALQRLPALVANRCDPVPSLGDGCSRFLLQEVPPRYRPSLKEGPVTQTATIPPVQAVAQGMTLPSGFAPIYVDRTKPAAAVFQWQKSDVRPAIQLVGDDSTTWTPQFDLLESSSRSTEFVLEVENDGSTLRFGDGKYAAQAAAGVTYLAQGPFQYGPPARNGYRVGNGTIGNVAAESIRHIVIADNAIASVINPLPAIGGVDPETIADVRQRAPAAFRTQERAVTPDDYATFAKRYPDPLYSQVRDAAATFRWTGSWYTVFLTVDRPNNQDVDQSFTDGLRGFFDRYRMAGQDVEIEGPLYVPLEIVLNVCVKPDYFQSDVTAELLDVFSDRVLPNGQKGVFHPDNFTFGQTTYLGPLYAAAQAVDGVASAQFTTFQRWGIPSTKALDDGKLVLHRTELARVSNDPSFPDHGVFTLNPEGGK